MSEFKFTRKTFQYFDGARKHANERSWFDENRALYTDHVEVPLTHLVMELRRELSPLLPGIDFSPRKISRPLLRVMKGSDGPVVREKATLFLAETATSMFESNPGSYISLGAAASDNVYGCGMYMPSARQVRELRPRLCAELASFEPSLLSAEMKKYWNGLSGDKYQRFPKDFDENAPAAKYLWYKQFFIGKDLTRDDVIQPDFIERTVDAFRAAAPFLTWTRRAVGIYRRPPTFE